MTSISSIPSVPKVFSLYRGHLREVRKLPHLYLQQFYKMKMRNDIRIMLAPSGALHLPTRLKRSAKGLRKLQAANSGNHKAFESILGLAYGRKGKLKWELLDPLLKDSSAPSPPKIIPQKEKSRPPVYSKPLIALLTNADAMATRPIRKDAWTAAKLLPARADRTSEEAHIFGPFSKRREYNIQWRYNRKERRKVLPPVEIVIGSRGAVWTPQKPPVAAALPLQDLGVFSDIERLVGVAKPPPLTRKERKAGITQEDANSHHRHPSGWVRRRYRSLLAELPILAYNPTPDGEGTYSVRLSDCAMGARAATNLTLREIDDTNLAWLKRGMEETPARGSNAKTARERVKKVPIDTEVGEN